MRTVGLGIIGLGTVGTGVVKILHSRRAGITERVGGEVRVERFCDKVVSSKPELGIRAGTVSRDYRELLADPKVDVIVELVGGYEPARSIILEALKAGKHVVTANKAVLAKHWDEIIGSAQKAGRLVYFEAAVGGGIPVIQGLNEGLAANRIRRIVGILNGTTNFILSKMSEEGLAFDEALKLAQASGFAESDPTFDVQGIDSAHKLAVLSSIAYGGWVKLSDVYTEGITHVNPLDLELARREFGYGLKLLGISAEHDGLIEARVHPAFLPLSHPFTTVKNEYNAIEIVGDASGDVIFYGKGAGQMPAASAVVSDVIFLARQVIEGTAGKLPTVTYDEHKKLRILDRKDFLSKYYLRFTTKDKPGVLSKISGILGEEGVSISSVYQPMVADRESQRSKSVKGRPRTDPHAAHILLTTHSAPEGHIQKAVQEIDRLPTACAKTVCIRIEEP